MQQRKTIRLWRVPARMPTIHWPSPLRRAGRWSIATRVALGRSVRQAGKLVLFGLALAGWALLALLATLLCAGWRAGRRQKGR